MTAATLAAAQPRKKKEEEDDARASRGEQFFHCKITFKYVKAILGGDLHASHRY
jgi:hypothetical protein